MMVQTEQTKGGDIVLMKGNVHKRVSEYGIRGVFSKGLPVTAGIVCEYCNSLVVVCFDKKISIKAYGDVESAIVIRYRSTVARNYSASLDLQDTAMSMFANGKSYSGLYKEINNNISATLLYILMSSKIRLPSWYSDFKFKMLDLVSNDNGFYRV